MVNFIVVTLGFGSANLSQLIVSVSLAVYTLPEFAFISNSEKHGRILFEWPIGVEQLYDAQFASVG